MKTKTIINLVIALLLGTSLVLPARSQPNNIIVNGAKAVSELSVSMSQALVDTTIGVGPRFIVQYANQLRYHEVGYPSDLVGDTTPPVISGVMATVTGDDAVLVTWTTDEIASSEVFYGENSGGYTGSEIDTLFVDSHAIQLNGLNPGTTYYYKVKSDDRSGNGNESTEHTFVIDIAIAGLAANNDSPTLLGAATTLSATVTAGSNVVYTWDFGDGETGEGIVVLHTYLAVGEHTATVTATNSVNFDTANTLVSIEPQINYIYIPLLQREQ